MASFPRHSPKSKVHGKIFPLCVTMKNTDLQVEPRFLILQQILLFVSQASSIGGFISHPFRILSIRLPDLDGAVFLDLDGRTSFVKLSPDSQSLRTLISECLPKPPAISRMTTFAFLSEMRPRSPKDNATGPL